MIDVPILRAGVGVAVERDGIRACEANHRRLWQLEQLDDELLVPRDV